MFKTRLDHFLNTYRWWIWAKAMGQDSGPVVEALTPNDDSRGPDKTQTSSSPPSGLAGSSNCSNNEIPVVFGFEGEYSIISPRENEGGKLGAEETWRRLENVVKEIEGKTGLRFEYVIQPFPKVSILNFCIV
jgi:hypothetical protein